MEKRVKFIIEIEVVAEEFPFDEVMFADLEKGVFESVNLWLEREGLDAKVEVMK